MWFGLNVIELAVRLWNWTVRLKAVRTLRTAIDSIGLGRYYTNHSSELTTRRTKLVTVRLDW